MKEFLKKIKELNNHFGFLSGSVEIHDDESGYYCTPNYDKFTNGKYESIEIFDFSDLDEFYEKVNSILNGEKK